jgi:hypothetical protein
VRLGGEHLGQGVVAAMPSVCEGLGEVALGETVLVTVVGDPPGELGQFLACRGQVAAGLLAVGAGGQQGGDLLVEVAGDGLADLAAAEPVVDLSVEGG